MKAFRKYGSNGDIIFYKICVKLIRDSEWRVIVER